MCFSLGSAMISWTNKKQKFVALSIAEAEYIATCIEAVWLRKLIYGLFDEVPYSTVIYCDNQSCMKLSEHLVFHDWSKPIDVWEVIC
jgi:hypothetical protein